MTRARTIAIGDIHGCAAALCTLLDEIQPTERDTIVTLGDYVDRGPNSRGVIDRLLQLSGRCRLVPLIGNHEVMMLDGLDQGGDRKRFWLQYGGQETLESYGGTLRGFPETHDTFLRSLRPFHETDTDIFVHANYDPELPMDQQPRHLTLWEHLSFHPPAPHCSGKTVFVGHTPQRTGEILDLDHIVAIDTACAIGGWLTAIDVDTRDIWQADREGNLR